MGFHALLHLIGCIGCGFGVYPRVICWRRNRRLFIQYRTHSHSEKKLRNYVRQELGGIGFEGWLVMSRNKRYKFGGWKESCKDPPSVDLGFGKCYTNGQKPGDSQDDSWFASSIGLFKRGRVHRSSKIWTPLVWAFLYFQCLESSDILIERKSRLSVVVHIGLYFRTRFASDCQWLKNNLSSTCVS